MFTIIIQEKGGEQRRMVFNKPEVTIGRVQGNDIVLPKGNVSKRHARIVLKDGKFIIVDLKSTNGTYVNGRKITSPLVVKDSDKIYIGDFIVGVDEAAGESEPESATSPPMEAQRLPASSAPDLAARPRPAGPTEAVPMPGMGGMGGGMPGMGGMGGGGMGAPTPEPAPGPPPPIAPRTGPPRQPPGPSRDLSRDINRGEPREPGLGGPPPREPGAMPPLGPPLGPPPGSEGVRTRPPLGRPGGTMPPPISPMIPPPIAPQPASTMADPHMPAPISAPPIGASARAEFAPPAPLPSPAPIAAPPVAPAPAPLSAAPQPLPASHSSGANGAPAQVVPLSAGARQQQRAQVSANIVKRTVGRSVSIPSRRGVHLDPLDPKVVKMLDLQSNILERLRAKLDLDKVPMDRLHEEDLWKRAERATVDLVETLETSGELPKYIDQDTLIKETLNEALALGPLEDLLADEKVDEIIIDKRDRVVVGKEGQLRGSGKAFSSDDVFERVVKRLVAEAGAHIDEAHPLVDLRMRDGTRLTAAVSPVASRGACLVLKKAAAPMPQLTELVSQGALSGGMADFLSTCMTARRNILVCGASGSGKTSVVAALAAAAPAGERVVSIEEVAELSIQRDEWIQLETRAGNGKAPSIDLATLLETAMRLGPDRLVVGEVRGREALPLVSSLCTSLDGAVVAMTGDGSSAALSRLVTLARVSASGASDMALRELVAQAFEIIVHVVRWTDGSLRVASIEEVVGCSDTSFDTTVLFQFANGNFGATGTVPRFYAELEARGIPADQAVFR